MSAVEDSVSKSEELVGDEHVAVEGGSAPAADGGAAAGAVDGADGELSLAAAADAADKKLRVIIIGGGMCGLTAALSLRQAGADVCVYERDEHLHSRPQGSDIGLRSTGLKAMESVGAAAPIVAWVKENGALGRDFHFCKPDGKVLARMHSQEGMHSAYGSSPVKRGVLRAALLEQLPEECVQWNKKLVDLEEDADGVTARFEDGSSAHGDVLLGCDGVNSATRRLWLGDKLTYLGFSMIRGFIKGDDLLSELGTADTYLLAEPGQSMFVAQNSKRAEEETEVRWALSFASEAESFDDKGFATDADALLQQAMRRTEHWAEPIKALVAATPKESLKLRNHYDRPAVTSAEDAPWVSKRITLLGDAAHPMTPYRGEGGNNALSDGAAVGPLLMSQEHSSLEAALLAVNDDMWRRSSQHVRNSRQSFEMAHAEDVWRKYTTFGWMMAIVQRPWATLGAIAAGVAMIIAL
eukprot:PLAT15193.1.p1 GENE.PLAT15193.1~~PLAT15193.1.p1  ORF type:complete len:477 (+),score=187.55 PLAT15193.1:33-1433(+)